ncbi:hypothetical protein BRADI_2g17095v3 [Brachypodium distachyon]|uniref:Uncharacterized protein n=1 Tax=Brachypodium distachyon TaxID=15368 RepID=A0A2K2D8Y1_BRADI|nr:hypothetical protein BRADI_2g17095v3 [Brachypodium distachyon]
MPSRRSGMDAGWNMGVRGHETVETAAAKKKARATGGRAGQEYGGGGGGPGGGGDGPGGGGGGPGRLPPFPHRLPYVKCQPQDCQTEAKYYYDPCYSVYCNHHVCACAGRHQVPPPGISTSDIRIYQPFMFPSAPLMFVGAFRQDMAFPNLQRRSYYFCDARQVFSTMEVLPVVVRHFDMHGQWISRMIPDVSMIRRDLMFPYPQFFWV